MYVIIEPSGPTDRILKTCLADCFVLEPMGTDTKVPLFAALGWFSLGTVLLPLLYLVHMLFWVPCYSAWCNKSPMRLGCPLWQLAAPNNVITQSTLTTQQQLQ